MGKILFAVVEPGPIRDALLGWRDRYILAQKAAFEFAEKHGANGIFQDWDGNCIALTPCDPIPEGWVIRRGRTKNGYPRLLPEKGTAAGQAAQEALAALPRHPSARELPALTGVPSEIRWLDADTGNNGFAMLRAGSYWHPTSLSWYGDTLILRFPSPDDTLAYFMQQHPMAEFTLTNGSESWTAADWKMPACLRLISEAELRLIAATYEVELEQAGREAA